MFGRLFFWFWIQRTKYWWSLVYSVLIDIITSTTVVGLQKGVKKIDTRHSNSLWAWQSWSGREGKPSIWCFKWFAVLSMCYVNVTDALNMEVIVVFILSWLVCFVFPASLWLKIQWSKYRPNWQWMFTGSGEWQPHLYSQVNGNEHKLRVGKAMLQIDITDEEFSGLRLKLEELLTFGWKLSVFSCW